MGCLHGEEPVFAAKIVQVQDQSAAAIHEQPMLQNDIVNVEIYSSIAYSDSGPILQIPISDENITLNDLGCRVL